MIQFSIPEPPVDDRYEQMKYERDAPPIEFCKECGRAIREGDTYVYLNDYYCMKCVEDNTYEMEVD